MWVVYPRNSNIGTNNTFGRRRLAAGTNSIQDAFYQGEGRPFAFPHSTRSPPCPVASMQGV
jgi:hypothetical protein